MQGLLFLTNILGIGIESESDSVLMLEIVENIQNFVDILNDDEYVALSRFSYKFIWIRFFLSILFLLLLFFRVF
jgi:hypothetical protein